MKRILFAVMLFAVTAPLYAQLPDAPLPARDRYLMDGVAAVRFEDAISTRYMLHHGWHEAILPADLANSTPGMFAFGAACTYAQFQASKWLIRHHHRTLATVSEVVHIAAVGYFATNNWRATPATSHHAGVYRLGEVN